MTKRKLTRIKFFAIRRELESTNRRQEDIAADYDVSSTTVSLVNKTRTWENFLVGKSSVKPVRSGRVSSKDPVVRKEKAAKAELHPVTREERQEKTIAEKLQEARERQEDWENSPVTRKSFNDHLRLNAAELRGKQDNNSLSNVALWFIVIVLFALVVTALVK